MQAGYWEGRWKRGETGWHQTEVEPALVERFSDLRPTRVLVPLCGKSLDLTWLESRGHEVIGVELSELACRAYFEERSLPFQVSAQGGFNVFHAGRVSIYQGNIFDLSPKTIPVPGSVYDRAALIALPAQARAMYAEKIRELARPRETGASFRFLQLVLERDPTDDKGPPHSVTEAELRSLYEPVFEIALLSREGLADMRAESGAKTYECVYSLLPRLKG